MKACAVYARVSTDMQGESLENQVEYAKEYVERLGPGFQLDENCVYTDFDQSGYYTRFVQRPAIQKALEDAKSRRYDVIVFKEISRISRDQAEHIEIVSRFTTQGIRVIAINDNLDSERPETLDLLGIHSVMSEMESKRISSRVSSGKKSLARRGLWVGEAPIGYLVDPETKHLMVDHVRAHIPVTIFRLFVYEGYGALKIAAYLNERGFLTKNGRLWSRVTVTRVLHNRAYVGDLVYGKTRNVLKRIYDETGYTKKKGRNQIPTKDWVVVEGTHPALVNRDTFKLAERRLQGRTSKNPRKARHPLTGILNCGRCGTGMVCQQQRYQGHVYRYYTCGGAFRFGRSYCDQPNIKAEPFEQQLFELLIRCLQVYKNTTIHLKEGDSQDGSVVARTKQVTRELAKARLGLERLLAEPDVSLATYNRLKASYLDTIRTLEDQLNSMKSEESTNTSQVRPSACRTGADFIHYLQSTFHTTSDGQGEREQELAELRRLFHGFIARIDVLDHAVTNITLKYQVD